jgi:hypothetical protein
MPRMRLFERRTVTPRSGNGNRLTTTKTVNTALTWLALALTVGAIGAGRPLLLSAVGVCLAVVLRNYIPQHRFFVRERGLAFALAVIPLELLSYLVTGMAVVFGRLLGEFLGEQKPHPTVEAFAEIGVQKWPPVPRRSDPVPQQPPATLDRPA